MTAQIEFFCSLSEERTLFEYLLKDPGVAACRVDHSGPVTAIDGDAVIECSLAAGPLDLLFVHEETSGLIWHDAKPKLSGDGTHGQLVSSVLAQFAWEQGGFHDGDRMLDTERTPLMWYRRGVETGGRMGQNTLLAPASNLQRVGNRYQSWVRRVHAWVRRRGKRVHGFRNPSSNLHNPHFLMNTIYAFPEVLEPIESGEGKYEISLLS